MNTKTNIKALANLSCTKNLHTAQEGEFIKVDGQVAMVSRRTSRKGCNGYVCWTLNLGGEDRMWLANDTLSGLTFETPTGMEALMLKTKLVVQKQITT